MNRTKKLIPILCGCLPLVLTLVFVLYALGTLFVPGPGGFYSRGRDQLDLRQQVLTVERYQRLQKRMPDTRIRWNVPLGDGCYDSDTAVLYPGEFSPEDVSLFEYFPELRQVNGSRSQSREALLALYEARPDLDVRWAVELGGKRLSQGCESLRFDAAELSTEELLDTLWQLPELNTLILDGTVSPEDQAALTERYPDIVFDWTVTLCGQALRSTDKTLSFAGAAMTAADLQTVRENIHRFYNPEVLDFTGCGLESADMLALREELGLEIGWDFTLCGAAVNSLDTEIDLSGIDMESAEEVEAALPCFTRLEKVIMSHCGISDEEMDALNKKYEDIRFVWTVQIGGYELRTDVTEFIATKDPHGYIHDRHTEGFRYCTDLVGLDLGHNFISDISFVRYMPHMKYLIVAENPVVDLSPLESLQELVFLEIFLTTPEDLTPLLKLPNLRDLNLCHTYTVKGDHAYEVLSQLTWVERIWYSGHAMTRDQEEALAEALPDCELLLKRGQESVCGNWRYGQHYYDMRDLFGMYYMNEWGDRVEGRRPPPFMKGSIIRERETNA